MHKLLDKLLSSFTVPTVDSYEADLVQRMQLLLVHHDWSKALDNGGQVDVVFIDFAKAFDFANHSILLNKLYKYGVRGSLLDWQRVGVKISKYQNNCSKL